MKKLAIIGIGAAAALMLPGSAFAQSDGVIQASATVSTVANIDAESPLAFGELAPSASKTVAPSDGVAAGSGYVAFSTNAAWDVSLTTPTELAHSTNTGAANIPVSITCGYSNAVGTNATATFTCGSGYSNAATVTAMEDVVVWLGGDITIPATAAAGEYTADISVTMTNP